MERVPQTSCWISVSLAGSVRHSAGQDASAARCFPDALAFLKRDCGAQSSCQDKALQIRVSRLGTSLPLPFRALAIATSQTTYTDPLNTVDT
jgi:hypothetical protein